MNGATARGYKQGAGMVFMNHTGSTLGGGIADGIKTEAFGELIFLDDR